MGQNEKKRPTDRTKDAHQPRRGAGQLQEIPRHRTADPAPKHVCVLNQGRDVNSLKSGDALSKRKLCNKTELPAASRRATYFLRYTSLTDRHYGTGTPRDLTSHSTTLRFTTLRQSYSQPWLLMASHSLSRPSRSLHNPWPHIINAIDYHSHLITRHISSHCHPQCSLSSLPGKGND